MIAILPAMKSTPVGNTFNGPVLEAMPAGLGRVVEVGCARGLLAAAYRAANPGCDYRGIEIDPDYAAAARQHCSAVVCADVETLPDDTLKDLSPADCWIFADSLEHMRDPWTLLRRLRPHMAAHTQIIACIPNMQHWSVQLRLSTGALHYRDGGLLDRTHLRWFTRLTMFELFAGAGYRVAEALPLPGPSTEPDSVLPLLRALAEAGGGDPHAAGEDALVYQWVLRAVAA